MGNLVLEGAEPNTTHLLSYCFLEDFEVPRNASIVRVGRARLFLRHNFEVIMERIRSTYKVHLDSYGGFDLREVCPNINWFFGMPRSLAVSDGRLFVNECHFTSGFEYYLGSIGEVVRDSCRIFKGQARDYDLNEEGKRIR